MIRTFYKDAPLIPWIFKSIEKFFPVHKEVVVVTDKSDQIAVSRYLPDSAILVLEETHMPGNIQQKYSKIMADNYCTGSYILHVDSDVVFNMPITPELLFKNGKPINEYVSWQYLMHLKCGRVNGTVRCDTVPGIFLLSCSPL